ncbi:hypothetical protein D3C81_316610 [compost metagenome]
MKQVLLKFFLRQVLSFVLADRGKVKLAVGLAEASYDEGDKPFTRRGRVYRFLKEQAPAGTEKYLLDAGTEAAQALDALSRK